MDIDRLAGRIGLDAEEYLELLELFCDTAESELSSLLAFLEAGDAVGASSAVHSLKGAAGNMGLDKVATTLARIEKRLQTQVNGDVLRAITAVQEQVHRLRVQAAV
jgi:HPt (histidine-containing phosphotransfer) domain-containing protein